MVIKQKGVQVRGEKIRIYFNHYGSRRYVSTGLPATSENIKECAEMVAGIEKRIKEGTFNFDKEFPSGPNSNSFASYAHDWLDSKVKTLSKSTVKSHNSRLNNWILPKWGAFPVEQIDFRAIQTWTNESLMSNLSNKTIKDIHSIVNQIFRHYRRCTGSTHDPIQGAFSRIPLALPDGPDPFTKTEIKRLLDADPKSTVCRMIKTAIFTGVRISELIALAWTDVDFERGTLTVQRARVASVLKATKTRFSTRKIKLMRPALEALREQYLESGDKPLSRVNVQQRDNRTWREQELGFVFLNPTTGNPFSTADNYRNNYWMPYLAKAGVRYRGPNTARHTFASQALSSGAVPLSWISSQLGHTGTNMLFKHYGAWIEEDQLDAVGVLEKALDI